MKNSTFSILVLLLFGTVTYAQDTIKLNPAMPGIKISDNFTGMAYESDGMHFDSLEPDNHTLIQFFKTAGIKTFRLGGNSVENYIYSPTVTGYPVDTLTNTELDSLFGFAAAVGSKIILGMNFGGHFDPSLAAKEASYVMAHYSTQLLAFEIGNEPNLYYLNGFRSPAYTYDSFKVQFMQYVDSIRKYNPTAPISGASAARNQAYTYTNPFAHDMKGVINLLTQHYYAIPENTGTTADRVDSLLNHRTVDSIKNLSDTLVMRADSDSVPFQMDECNALYPYSRWGVNNSFASALWVLDYMYSLAELGVQGINVHTTYNTAATVINRVARHYSAEPLYYGMLAFQLNNNGNVLPYTFIGSASNLAIHPLLDTVNNIYVTLINKDTLNPISLQLYADSTKYQTGQMLSLTAPLASDTFDVTLGGTSVASNGTWSPSSSTSVPYSHGYFSINIPAANAIILQLDQTTLTGIHVISQDAGLSVYPNPAKNEITIQFVETSARMIGSDGQNFVSAFRFYDIAGREVLNQKLTKATTTIDCSGLSEGAYLYKITDESGRVIKADKIVVVH